MRKKVRKALKIHPKLLEGLNIDAKKKFKPFAGYSEKNNMIVILTKDCSFSEKPIARCLTALVDNRNSEYVGIMADFKKSTATLYLNGEPEKFKEFLELLNAMQMDDEAKIFISRLGKMKIMIKKVDG